MRLVIHSKKSFTRCGHCEHWPHEQPLPRTRQKLLCTAWATRASPAFAAEFAAVGLRNIRTHWGKINTRAAEIRNACDAMFRADPKIHGWIQSLSGGPTGLADSAQPSEGLHEFVKTYA
jgi:hypothetical protein